MREGFWWQVLYHYTDVQSWDIWNLLWNYFDTIIPWRHNEGRGGKALPPPPLEFSCFCLFLCFACQLKVSHYTPLCKFCHNFCFQVGKRMCVGVSPPHWSNKLSLCSVRKYPPTYGYTPPPPPPHTHTLTGTRRLLLHRFKAKPCMVHVCHEGLSRPGKKNSVKKNVSVEVRKTFIKFRDRDHGDAL